MFKLPFGPSDDQRKKLLLAFEYGLALENCARENGVELTPELVERAEGMIESEFQTHTPTFLAVNMVPNLLTVFELDLTK